MAYILGQYNKNKNVADDSIFMTLITEGNVRRRDSQSDIGVSGGGINFSNECIQIPSLMLNTNNYYFHGKIKRMRTDQTFYIKLVNYDSNEIEQYLKAITVGAGDPNDWVDIELVFTPYINFDCILFDLQRTISDYAEEVRYPIIIYEELSLVNNLIVRKIGDGVKLIKLGVQSRPGLLLCINGEEIRVAKNGIYELKNGVITVNFFSVISAADEATTIMETTMSSINTAWNAADALPTARERESAKSAIGSRSLLNTNKKRVIDSFTLDYLYREE